MAATFPTGTATPGTVDNIMSRLATISDSTGTLAAYTYLGAGTDRQRGLCRNRR